MTCAAAIELPLMVVTAASPVCQVEVMLAPGANRSMQLPWLPLGIRASVLVVPATVSAAATRAGE